MRGVNVLVYIIRRGRNGQHVSQQLEQGLVVCGVRMFLIVSKTARVSAPCAPLLCVLRVCCVVG